MSEQSVHVVHSVGRICLFLPKKKLVLLRNTNLLVASGRVNSVTVMHEYVGAITWWLSVGKVLNTS